MGGVLHGKPPVGQPGYHVVDLPARSPTGDRTQTEVLLETAHLRLTRVFIPRGGALPTHAAPHQVSVQALFGSGELRVGDVPVRIDPEHLLVLAPGTDHSVKADAGSDLTLLIHHVLRGQMGRGPRR